MSLSFFPPFFFFFFYLTIIVPRCCMNFCCTAFWISHMYTYILLPPEPPSHIRNLFSPPSPVLFFSTYLEAGFIIDSFVKFTRSFFWVFHLLPLIYSYIYTMLFKIYLFIWLWWVSVVASGIFSCGPWDLVPRLGIEFRPLALESWSLSHWTTREGPGNSKYTI